MEISDPNHVSTDRRKNDSEAENGDGSQTHRPHPDLSKLSLGPHGRQREDMGKLLKDGNVGGALAEGLLRLFDK